MFGELDAYAEGWSVDAERAVLDAHHFHGLDVAGGGAVDDLEEHGLWLHGLEVIEAEDLLCR